MGQWSWVNCVCVFLVISQCTGSLGCLEQERRALLHLYSKYNLLEYDDNGKVKPPKLDCCAWDRVKCNPTTHRVTQLSLSNILEFAWGSYLDASYFLPFKELQHLDLSTTEGIASGDPKIESYLFGRLTGFEKLSKLKKLEVLNLQGNNFNSSLLQSVGAIKSLKSLDISGMGGDSRFVSPSGLSKVFPNLWNLEVLDASKNGFNLNGIFPFEDMENMRKLKTLNLSENNMSGSIPRSIFLSFSSLESAILWGNNLTGSLTGFCGWKNLRVLDLASNNFEGCIPPCLSNLTSLRQLNVGGNQLTGIIPPSLFYGFTCLEFLDFSRNQLSGKIPMSSISNLTSLQYISFGQNQFRGIDSLNPFVDHKFQLKLLDLSHCDLKMSTAQLLRFLHTQYSLRYIDLSYSNLHGTFPYSLIENSTSLSILLLGHNSIDGHLSFPGILPGSLLVVDISNNQIQGELQLNIGDFISGVEILNLSRNSLEGRIPSSLGNLKELFILDLSSNSFSGEIPALGFSCKKLEALVLSNNRLDGQIFPSFFQLPSLEILRLNNNQLTGNLSIHLGKVNSDQLHPLQTLDISQNHISGRVPSWLANFPKLTSVSMRNNALRGPIPIRVCNSSLKFLDLSENHLSGSLPSCLSLTPLQYIHLHNNNLTGTIPKQFFESSDLLTLDLMYNKFSGNIPNNVGASENLRILLLKGNSLNGSVPHELCKMNKIGLLDLSHNNLSGSIPPCFGKITFGKTEAAEPVFQDQLWTYLGIFDTPRNHLKRESYEEPIFSDFTDQEEVGFTTKNRDDSYKGHILNLMSGMDLSCNQFTGVIPLEIGALTGVHALNFSHNQLTGRIPITLSNLKQLESLDLSHNKFSGEIPSDLTGLFNLAVFTVAYNNLSGRVPDMKAQFSTFQETSYEGNQLLCGPPLKKQCNSKIKGPAVIALLSGLSEKYEIDIVSLLASFAATSAMSLLGLVIVLYINPYWRRLWFDFVDACLSFMFPFCSEAIYRTSNPFT